MPKDKCPREKNWKQVYTRSNKLQRAKQLGFDYPRLNENHMVENESLNLLFICSMNQWRSPTAEKVYAKKPLVQVRSCGTSKNARRTVSSNDLKWANIVLVMEKKHKQQLTAKYPGEMQYKDLRILDIPDDYQFMDPDLVEEIINAVDPILRSQFG